MTVRPRPVLYSTELEELVLYVRSTVLHSTHTSYHASTVRHFVLMYCTVLRASHKNALLGLTLWRRLGSDTTLAWMWLNCTSSDWKLACLALIHDKRAETIGSNMGPLFAHCLMREP